MLMDPADGRHQVYTMDVWDHRHRMLKSWNQLIFSSWAFWHHLPFLLFSLTAHNLCCLYARNRRGAVGAKARMNKLDRRVPQCLDKDALSLLHTSPWSLEPGRAIVNIHMQSISAQGEIPLTESGNRGRIEAESMSNRPLRTGRRGGFEGGAQGSVPNKPLARLPCSASPKISDSCMRLNPNFGRRGTGPLEAQQRYFSYRAMLVAIVSQNSFVLVFMGYRTVIARYVAKWGIAQMCLCKLSTNGGVSHHFGGVLASL